MNVNERHLCSFFLLWRNPLLLWLILLIWLGSYGLLLMSSPSGRIRLYSGRSPWPLAQILYSPTDSTEISWGYLWAIWEELGFQTMTLTQEYIFKISTCNVLWQRFTFHSVELAAEKVKWVFLIWCVLNLVCLKYSLRDMQRKWKNNWQHADACPLRANKADF